MTELQAALGAADLSGSDANRKVDRVIARFAADPGPPTLPAMMPDIDRCFSAESVAEIEAKLKEHGGEWAGIVEAYVPSARMNDVQAALGAADLSGPDAHRRVDAVIESFAEDAGRPTLPALMLDIDRCFSAESVAEIEAKLRKHPGEWANKQLAALMKLSPLSMAITLEQLRRCANRSFEDTMTIEYRMVQHAMRPDHDFFEGVRALLIDKDQKPKWKPPTIDGVTRAMVDEHFKPVANDLFFD